MFHSFSFADFSLQVRFIKLRDTFLKWPKKYQKGENGLTEKKEM